jgi:exoribonuclease-2
MANFRFLDFARDYYGHDPSPVEATAVLLALHAAPVYFHRKGKGRFRKAPADILAAALASLEKKRQQALTIEGWIAELKEFRLPPVICALTDCLLYAPDRNKPETKAFETACAETGLSGSATAVPMRRHQVALLPALPPLPARAVPERHWLSRRLEAPRPAA